MTPALHWEGTSTKRRNDSDLGIWVSDTGQHHERLSQAAVDLPSAMLAATASVLCFEGNWQAETGTVSANLTLGDYPFKPFQCPLCRAQGKHEVVRLCCLHLQWQSRRRNGLMQINVAGQISSDLKHADSNSSVVDTRCGLLGTTNMLVEPLL